MSLPVWWIKKGNYLEYILQYFSTGNGQSREPALCQLYRHTFVPYWTYEGINKNEVKLKLTNKQNLQLSSLELCKPNYYDLYTPIFFQKLSKYIIDRPQIGYMTAIDVCLVVPGNVRFWSPDHLRRVAAWIAVISGRQRNAIWRPEIKVGHQPTAVKVLSTAG